MDTSKDARAQIAAHRAEIDALDARIVELLNLRAGESLAIRALKPQAGMDLYDPGREERIVERVCARNRGPLTDGGLGEIYAALLKVMKETPA